MVGRLVTSIVVVFLVGAVLAGCGGSGSEATAGCKRLGEAAEKFSAILTGDDFDVLTVAEDLKDGSAFFLPGAPDEIRDDMGVLSEAVLKWLDAFTRVNLLNPDQKKLQRELAAGIDTQRVAQASQNITAWVEANCT